MLEERRLERRTEPWRPRPARALKAKRGWGKSRLVARMARLNVWVLAERRLALRPYVGRCLGESVDARLVG